MVLSRVGPGPHGDVAYGRLSGVAGIVNKQAVTIQLARKPFRWRVCRCSGTDFSPGRSTVTGPGGTASIIAARVATSHTTSTTSPLGIEIDSLSQSPRVLRLRSVREGKLSDLDSRRANIKFSRIFLKFLQKRQLEINFIIRYSVFRCSSVDYFIHMSFPMIHQL